MVTQEDMLQAVRESALLASVTIGMFNAEKSEKTPDGRLVKNTMAGADDKLKSARSAFARVRTLHYGLTLPWTSDPHAERQTGPRLLPHLLLDRYLSTLTGQKRVAMGLLEDFLTEYPALVEAAAGYPSVEEIRRQFRIHIEFEPIPTIAFKGMDAHVMERMTKSLHERQTRMVENASQAMWDEVRARVEHLVERLEGDDTRFKKPTIENVRELITLLPGWNLTGAPEATRVVEDIRTTLDGVDAETLRKSVPVRARVLIQARGIVERIRS